MRLSLSCWSRRGLPLLLALGLLIAACAPPRPTPAPSAAAPPPERLRVAYGSISGSMLPIWLAKDEGLYARYGLEVEPVYIAGAVKVAEALLSGEIDIGGAGASTAMAPGLEGADLVMIGSWTNKLSFSLFVGPEIHAVAELRGKRLGTVRRGSNSEIWTNAVLAGFGLEPERDYSVAAIGGQPEQVAALQNRAIDAAVLLPPSNLQARKLGYTELLGAREYGLDYANVGPISSRRFLRDQPAVVERYLRATAEAVALMFQAQPQAEQAVGRYTQTDDPEVLAETVAFELSRTSRDMLPSAAGLRAAMDELAATNPRAATANPDDYVDLAPLQRLIDSGFIAALYR